MMTPTDAPAGPLLQFRPSNVLAIGLLIGGLALLASLGSLDFTANPLFHPHGYCYLWEPGLVGAHVSADSLIGLSYFTISLTLGYLVVRSRRQIPFSWMVLLFGAFIVACGATHLMEVVTLWYPTFWTSASLKILTAAVSVGAAVALPPLVPRVLQLVRAAQLSEAHRAALEEANRTLEERVAERTAALEALAAKEYTLRGEAEAANRTKDEFLGIVSHELRTPLNAILGWSSILGRDNLGPVMRQRAAESIVRSARIQAQVVDDLLDVSRIVAGKLGLNPEPVPLARAIDLALDTVKPAAEAKRIVIERRDEAIGVYVSADAGRLQQILWNLLANAIKFTPAHGTIRVRLTAAEDKATVEIEDSGVGIAPAFLPHVFERFSQADSRADRPHTGLGLGLALVRHLTELHGGVVRAWSDGLGQGATFSVQLPLLEINESVHGYEPEGHVQSPDLTPYRVLLVDDDQESLNALEVGLIDFGGTVVTATGASAARACIAEAAPHVLVTDLAMPGEDGIALVRSLRALHLSIPAILLTAHVRRSDATELTRAGFQACLYKPVTPLELARAIASVARQSG
jgi:signal transduction histidine kinase